MSAFEAIPLKPSRSILASALALHCGAGLALFLYVADTLSGVLGGLALLLSLIAALRQQYRTSGLVLTIYSDGGAAVGDGKLSAPARVNEDAVILPHVLFMVLKYADARPRARTLRLMLVADNMNAAQWRRLKVWLRHQAVRLAVVSP